MSDLKTNSERAQAPVRHGAGDPAADADGAGHPPAILKSANGSGRVMAGTAAPDYQLPILGSTGSLDAAYNYFRARILADPAVLAVLRAGKSIEVVDQIATIEMGGDSASGAVAGLVEEGFFGEPRTGNAVCKELIDRRRKSFARSTVYDACDVIAGYGFLVKDKSGYVAVPGVAIRRRTA